VGESWWSEVGGWGGGKPTNFGEVFGRTVLRWKVDRGKDSEKQQKGDREKNQKKKKRGNPKEK